MTERAEKWLLRGILVGAAAWFAAVAVLFGAGQASDRAGREAIHQQSSSGARGDPMDSWVAANERTVTADP